ncbi:MAG: metallophosphoesterase [Chroococcidiopsidaceae cyanobacterium CP_BM_RX_35]|nr:metallophosphoesterase [Chroococcidiopsidaceae cyanobacterium CP_BM_RX_35]
MQRRKFINHVGWTGLGIVWAVSGENLLTSCTIGTSAAKKQLDSTSLSFVQISDSHIGFHKPANEHVTATLQKAIDAINALPTPPAFVVHTGDITHLSKPAEFDQAKQLLSQLKVPLFTLPGEHDVIGDRGKAYSEAFSQGDKTEGLQLWDHSGVHFVSLTNVLDFGETGEGKLGQAQLDLLAKDLAAQKPDTPLVVFSHIPLYDLYPKWGWATADAAKVLSLLSRFSSVTVLNGHIHQVVHHTEGNIRFSTAAATAYPLPPPGQGAQPAPVTLPENHLLAALGFRTVEFAPRQDVKVDQHSLA